MTESRNNKKNEKQKPRRRAAPPAATRAAQGPPAPTPGAPPPAQTGDSEGRAVTTAHHLIGGGNSALNELEFGIILASHAFQRWVVRCMAAAGARDLSPLDSFVLHITYDQHRPKRVTDICFALNIEDTHLASYAVRKLCRLGLIEGMRRGKETFFAATAEGKRVCDAYRDVRQRCLLSTLASLGDMGEDLSELARMLRTFSGIYDQAARAATVL